jgi:hypothetical protein
MCLSEPNDVAADWLTDLVFYREKMSVLQRKIRHDAPIMLSVFVTLHLVRPRFRDAPGCVG